MVEEAEEKEFAIVLESQVSVVWLETGARFSATIKAVNADGSYDILYDDRVRGKLVTERHVSAQRVTIMSSSSSSTNSSSSSSSRKSTPRRSGVGAGGSSSSSSTSSSGIFQRLAQLRDEGEVDLQTLRLSSTQVLQVHDALTVSQIASLVDTAPDLLGAIVSQLSCMVLEDAADFAFEDAFVSSEGHGGNAAAWLRTDSAGGEQLAAGKALVAAASTLLRVLSCQQGGLSVASDACAVGEETVTN